MHKNNGLPAGLSGPSPLSRLLRGAARRTGQALTLVAGLCLASQAWAAPPTLQSDQIAITINQETGQLAEVTNRLTGRTDPIRDEGALLVFADFDIDLGKTPFNLVAGQKEEIRFRAESNGIEILLTYRLRLNQAWAERELAVINKRRERVVL